MTLHVGGVAVIVTAQAGALRRDIGPTAWAVFEDVALASDGRCARTSARRVADRLGITPTAAAAALAKLRRRDLVRLVPVPDDRLGLFIYVLAPAEGFMVVGVVAGAHSTGTD